MKASPARFVPLLAIAPSLLAVSLGCPKEPSTSEPSAGSNPSSAAAVAAMPADAELRTLLQRTLDHPRLAPYWHADLPGRRPLRLMKNAASHLTDKLTMHGAPVEVLELSKLEEQKLPYFELRALRAAPERVTVLFRYPAEGVVGEIAWVKQGSSWVEEKVEIAER